MSLEGAVFSTFQMLYNMDRVSSLEGEVSAEVLAVRESTCFEKKSNCI